MRRYFKLIIAATTMAVAGPAAAQRDFSAVEIQTVRVSDGIHVLVGAGGNIGLSTGTDGAFLVDDQYAPLTTKIWAAIGEITDAEVEFIINTHWHGDHTGGNENFAASGSTVVAHDNVRTRLRTEQFVPLFDHRAPPAPDGALPVVTFSDAVTFHWNDKTIHAFHVERAHTDGDAIIHFVEDDVFHMGDVYWTSGYPRIDVGNGGSLDGVIAAVDKVITKAADGSTIIPGHGELPTSGLTALREYRRMLKSIRDNVQALIDQGMSEQQAVSARPTESFDADWGGGYVTAEKFVQSVYVSLTE
jgi:glyoxylase-like metal-dependent hydrolase (beta-lactamase superfamily II)